jgi:hypothetical protein
MYISARYVPFPLIKLFFVLTILAVPKNLQIVPHNFKVFRFQLGEGVVHRAVLNGDHLVALDADGVVLMPETVELVHRHLAVEHARFHDDTLFNELLQHAVNGGKPCGLTPVSIRPQISTALSGDRPGSSTASTLSRCLVFFRPQAGAWRFLHRTPLLSAVSRGRLPHFLNELAKNRASIIECPERRVKRAPGAPDGNSFARHHEHQHADRNKRRKPAGATFK